MSQQICREMGDCEDQIKAQTTKNILLPTQIDLGLSHLASHKDRERHVLDAEVPELEEEVAPAPEAEPAFLQSYLKDKERNRLERLVFRGGM